MSRPAKYTKQQLRAQRRIWNREANRRRRLRVREAKLAAGLQPEQQDPRPPIEVIMERDYRRAVERPMLLMQPPSEYASRYAATAARLQAGFALGI